MLQPEKLFGGLAVFFFGDIMQLPPVSARMVFQQPKCPDYKLNFQLKPHWKEFSTITLEKNHRQDEDREYADLLNRLRVGKQTEEDINLLNSRVQSEGHPDLNGATYISCTNEMVIQQNNVRLNELTTELIEIDR